MSKYAGSSNDYSLMSLYASEPTEPAALTSSLDVDY